MKKDEKQDSQQYYQDPFNNNKPNPAGAGQDVSLVVVNLLLPENTMVSYKSKRATNFLFNDKSGSGKFDPSSYEWVSQWVVRQWVVRQQIKMGQTQRSVKRAMG